MSQRFHIGHCTNTLYPPKICHLYDKLPVVEVSSFVGSDKIICCGVALPVFCIMMYRAIILIDYPS
jgi:hypothetical protein